MFLITGCGRSGTKYISLVLNQAGLSVGHETLGEDGIVSSIWAVEDTWYPAYHHQERPEFDLVLVQLREPLPAISSLTTASRASLKWNKRHVPISIPASEDQRLATAAEYWWRWNLMCLTKYKAWYRIEDLEQVWPAMQQALGISVDYKTATGGISTSTNARKHKNYTWDDIARVTDHHDEIRNFAQEVYGERSA